MDRRVPGTEQARHARARLVELDQDVALAVGIDPLHVAPEERIDRRFDRIPVEPERVGNRRRVARIAALEAQVRSNPETPDLARRSPESPG